MTIDFPNRRVRAILAQLLEAGLQAADSHEAVRKILHLEGKTLRVGNRPYKLSEFARVICVGAGKASGGMALAAEHQLGEWLTGGVVVVKEGLPCRTRTITIRKAGHPYPNKRSERAAKEVLKLVRSLKRNDLLLLLISGGASSLLAAPAARIRLADKQRTTQLLLESGATIHEINVVRKHLSAIKGGRLAEATSGTVIGLLLSDVPGNDVSTIGSGLAAPDPSTFEDARTILQAYDLWKRIPQSVRYHLQQGLRGVVSETPKPGNPLFRRTYHHVVSDNRLAIEHIAKMSGPIGLRPIVLTTTLTGEAREAGKMIGAVAREIHFSGRPIPRPACLIWGGELTVSVQGPGKGGRAQEFALSAAQEIAGLPNLFVAGFGTDGMDGPTEAAGAVVDGHTVPRARQKGLDVARILRRNDSYSFFKNAGGQIITGPTGTNVNDLYLVLAL